jgi:hypothetical protein
MNHTRKPKIPSFTAQPLNDDELGLIAAYRALPLDLRPKVKMVVAELAKTAKKIARLEANPVRPPHQPQAAE